jgi:hypothetical protein
MDILHEYATYQGYVAFNSHFREEDREYLTKEIVGILTDRSTYPTLSAIASGIALLVVRKWNDEVKGHSIHTLLYLIESIKTYLVAHVISKQHDYTTIESHALLLLFGCAFVLRPDLLC